MKEHKPTVNSENQEKDIKKIKKNKKTAVRLVLLSAKEFCY